MYIFALIIAAALIISIFSTNWPVKFYHHAQLMKLGQKLGVDPVKHGLFFSGVYSELRFQRGGKEIMVRFLEGSADSLFANSGLEVRVNTGSTSIIQIFRVKAGKSEWGEFKRFLTSNQEVDSQWFILTDDPVNTKKYWEISKIEKVLVNKYLEQVQINQGEIVLKFRRMIDSEQITELIESV